MSRPLTVRWLGRVEYDEAVRLQEAARSRVRVGDTSDHLFLLEHPPVYTLGRNADRTDITADPEWLARRGIEVHESDRGGKVTYHGPGQLVGYPVLNLAPDRQDIRKYVRAIQEVLVKTLADFGVSAAARREQPEIGVWAGEAKIASVGIHIQRWVTTHGFALNVTTDLEHFGGLVPCGLSGVAMASIESVSGLPQSTATVADRTAVRFREVFGYHAVEKGAGE